MNVSTPEATAVDLGRYVKASGALHNIATVLKELRPSLEPKWLALAARTMGDFAAARRLGYLLEHVKLRRVAKPLKDWAVDDKVYPVPLRPGRPIAGATLNQRWRIIVNDNVEAEA